MEKYSFTVLIVFFFCCTCNADDIIQVFNDTACTDDEMIIIQASASHTQPRWYGDGVLDTTLKGIIIRVPAKNGTVYEARTAQDTIKTNLLSNGGFEGHNGKYQYSGFESKFTPPIKNGDTIVDPENASINYFEGEYGHHYAVMKNAKRFRDSYYPITPHSGDYYALFDVTNTGYAWKATTKNNPQLTVQKDSIYEISFWMNTPNYDDEIQYPKPKLSIEAFDGNSNKIQIIANSNDGIEIKVGNDHEWQHFTGYYIQHDADCNNFEITIKNLTNSPEGNDFCLDDIEFSLLSFRNEIIDVHTIVTKKCNECTDSLVYAKWNNMLFVDKGTQGLLLMGDTPVAFQWFKNGEPLEGETGQIYYNPNDMTGEFYCKITLQNGNTIRTCPHNFYDTERSAERNPGDYSIPHKIITRKNFGLLKIDYCIDETGKKFTIKRIIY